MKIRTIDDLQKAVDAETAWRKKEISDLWMGVRDSSGPKRSAYLRAAAVVLYSHWEGWVKRVAQLYIEHINTQKLNYCDLSAPIMGVALKTKILQMEGAKAAAVHEKFAAFIQEDLGSRASLSMNIVDTQSNLSSAVFLDIVTRLGLEGRDKYLTQSNLIDEDLVAMRNSIAHGEYLPIDINDFGKLKASVMELLDLFTSDVLNAASQRKFVLSR